MAETKQSSGSSLKHCFSSAKSVLAYDYSPEHSKQSIPILLNYIKALDGYCRLRRFDVKKVC